MRRNTTVSRASLVAASGLAALAVFELLLAVGAPLGSAAWGGTHDGQLPTSLRIASAVSAVVYVLAGAVVLRRGGAAVRGVSRRVAHVGCWVLVVLLALGAVPNFASASGWERYLMGPLALALAGACLVVARSDDRDAAPATDGATRAPAHR